jgi:uncharacterized RDD family membrane protein YckC
MMCPVCKRELAPTLSICLTCGAMMNDTVREELETKISINSDGFSAPPSVKPSPRPEFLAPQEEPKFAEPEKHPAPRMITTELPNKNTSQTLVDFQNKNAMLPDWRLQLQNAVRQRGSVGREIGTVETAPVAAYRAQPATNGSNALKLEIESVPRTGENANPMLASAMQRIESSRKAFLKNQPKKTEKVAETSARKFPFEVVAPNDAITTKAKSAEPVKLEKPKLVTTFKIEKKPFDTNKLPPIPQPEVAPMHIGTIIDGHDAVAELASPKIEKREIEQEEKLTEPFVEETFTDEIDDLAPFSMRFGAGLFDLIIGGFGTLIILSPFLMSGGTWASVSGVLTLVAALAIFLFLYMTASLAVWGRTFGMRLFSLELIDAEANRYPTVHQAAVSSAVYLLSMAFAGLGFVTVFYNEEKRAIHDIVSGTLLIREI